jgi:hypothetical protein
MGGALLLSLACGGHASSEETDAEVSSMYWDCPDPLPTCPMVHIECGCLQPRVCDEGALEAMIGSVVSASKVNGFCSKSVYPPRCALAAPASRLKGRRRPARSGATKATAPTARAASPAQTAAGGALSPNHLARYEVAGVISSWEVMKVMVIELRRELHTGRSSDLFGVRREVPQPAASGPWRISSLRAAGATHESERDRCR